MKVEATLLRDVFGRDYTLGRFFVEDQPYGFTCEDADRFLERENRQKIIGETAIPRGCYRCTLTYSTRFFKDMPQLIDVPRFAGIRIHGGNTSHDTEGCPLLGKERTLNGVRDCKRINKDLIALIESIEAAGNELWVIVR